MHSFGDYVFFRKFITPVALQLLFWAGIGGTLYGSWWLYTHDNWAWKMAIIFGPLLVRLIFENFMLRYQTYICLTEIREKVSA